MSMKKNQPKRKPRESVLIIINGIREIEEMSRHPNSDARIRQVAENLVSEIENNPKVWGGI